MRQEKICPPDTILNPKSNRCVKKDGRIGKSILAGAAVAVPPAVNNNNTGNKKATKKPVKVVSFKVPDDDKNTLLPKLLLKCNNDADPITMESFSDMDVEQLKFLVPIGKGDKKNCYLLENIYEVYKNAVLSKKDAKDPMDPSHVLTTAEKGMINKLMKEKDPAYKPPKYKLVSKVPKDYDISITLSNESYLFYRITITYRGQLKFDLGVVPAFVEIEHTGSVDFTSSVLVSSIRELWEQGWFVLDNGKCCKTDLLGKSFSYWTHDPNWDKFKTLCSQVRFYIE